MAVNVIVAAITVGTVILGQELIVLNRTSPLDSFEHPKDSPDQFFASHSVF